MKTLDALQLLLLSAIWGASFLFMRIASPEFGPIPLILIRVGIAALLLAPIMLTRQNRPIIRRHIVHLFVVGALNSSLPFCLLSYSTLSLEAGFTSLLNAMVPIFTAWVGVVWVHEKVSREQGLGLFLGLTGVAVLSWGKMSFKAGGAGWAILAGLVAALCYAISVHYYKAKFAEVPGNVVAAGSTFTATLLLLPPGLWLWPSEVPSAMAWISAACIGVFSTALAFILFYRLVQQISALAAASVAFLIPIFAVLWGALFLGEEITPRLIIGMLI
ncbi:MAG: DMT family transporter, partial [Verrucomicrobiota bacterium]